MRNCIVFLAFSAAAFGQCGSAGRLIKNPLTGLWDCTAVVGAGTGSVTSVGLAGTANQITVTGATPITDSGSWTLSLPTAGVTLPGTTTIGILSAKQNVMDAVSFCSDAGSTDDYACNLTPAISAYVTGTHYRFLANTANTGAATVALNSLAAKTIVKVAGGITTALATNDIRVGQWVDIVYDGTNMQMQSTLGNAGGAGTPGGSDTQCQYNNSGAFGGITGCTTNGTAVTLVAPALGTPTALVLTNATGLPAASILPGTFGAGNYTVNGNLTVGTSLSVDGTTGIATTSKIGNAALSLLTGAGKWLNGVPVGQASCADLADASTTCATAGANRALSNLSSVSINAGLIPQTTLSLGAQATPWQNLYIYGQGTFGSHSIKFDGTPTGNRVITFPDATATVATLDGSQALTNKTYNGNTWTAGTGVLAIAAAKTLTASNTLTLAGTDSTTMTFPSTSATIARTDAANTFTGTQTIGALVATTVNGNTFTAGTGVLTIAAAKTLTVSNTLTLAGTDGITMTTPTTSFTAARTDAANAFTGPQTINASNNAGLTINVGSSGYAYVRAGNAYVGEDNTAGTFWTGGTAHAAFLVAGNATPAEIGTNGIIRMRIDTGGHYISAGSTPAITSGFGGATGRAILGTDGIIRVTAGNNGTDVTGLVTFGTAWVAAPVCTANNETTAMLLQAVPTTTTVTINAFALATGSAVAFTSADKISINCGFSY